MLKTLDMQMFIGTLLVRLYASEQQTSLQVFNADDVDLQDPDDNLPAVLAETVIDGRAIDRLIDGLEAVKKFHDGKASNETLTYGDIKYD